MDRLHEQGESDLRVALTWTLRTEGVTRTVTIDDSEIETLRQLTTYSRLDQESPNVDLVMSEILTGVMDTIKSQTTG